MTRDPESDTFKELQTRFRTALRETDDMTYDEAREHLGKLLDDIVPKLPSPDDVVQVKRTIAQRLFMTAACTDVSAERCREILERRGTLGYAHITEKSTNWLILARVFASSGLNNEALELSKSMREELLREELLRHEEQDAFIAEAVARLDSFALKLQKGELRPFR